VDNLGAVPQKVRENFGWSQLEVARRIRAIGEGWYR